MSASLNRAIIMGHLGADPELRYTPNQVAVANFNVATTEAWNNKDGQRQETTEWHRIVVFSRVAENCAKYLKKGRPVLVEGRIQTRSWDDPNGGGKKYMTEILANTVQFLGGRDNADYNAIPADSYGSSSSYGGGAPSGGATSSGGYGASGNYGGYGAASSQSSSYGAPSSFNSQGGFGGGAQEMKTSAPGLGGFVPLSDNFPPAAPLPNANKSSSGLGEPDFGEIPF